MAITIMPAEDFAKGLKQICKKHKGIRTDIAKLSTELNENPKMGIDLGQNVYKIRLAISGTN